jgi:biotin carboxyl carrier protein
MRKEMTAGLPYDIQGSLDILIDGRKETVSIQPSQGRSRVFVGNQQVDADLAKISENVYSLILDGHSYHIVLTLGDDSLRVIVDGTCYNASVLDPKRLRSDPPTFANLLGPSPVVAPMSGKIVKVLVAVGDSVTEGQGVVVIEAMKMQNELRAPQAGKVEKVIVAESQAVNAGDILLVVQ